MSEPFSHIVTDTSPLFTLVLAGSLDILLRPGLPVRIPDAVYIEATPIAVEPEMQYNGHPALEYRRDTA